MIHTMKCEPDQPFLPYAALVLTATGKGSGYYYLKFTKEADLKRPHPPHKRELNKVMDM